MNRKGLFLLTFILLAALLAGCGPAVPPARPSPTPTPSISLPALDDEAIRALVQYEAELLVNKDIDQLMALWLPDGYVADARHTPDNATDDLVWKGQYAVRDRYITVVFPGNPQFAQPEILSITIDGERATATSTTRIEKEVSPAGDRWTFRKLPDGWKIESLTYNLETK